MTIDILIIHLNGEKVIYNCLNSIYKNTRSINKKNSEIKVRILLNNSSDKSEEIIKEKFPDIEIYRTEKTIGFAEACNFLASKSNADYIVFLNNDTEVKKDWLNEMLETIKKHKNCVVCQPKIKSYCQKEMFEYAGAAGGFIDKYGYPFCRGRIFDSVERDIGQYNDEKRIFWACGVCFFVNRDFFIKTGGFDEDFFMYAEELDFCWRANIYGKEIWYCPTSEIYHVGSYSVRKEKINFKKEYLIIRNHILLLLKNYSALSLIKILPLRIILEIISSIRFFPVKTISLLKTCINLPFIYIMKTNKKRNKIQLERKVHDEEMSKLMAKESIALDYFIKGKRKFNEINFK
ncbi:glycosyltransferase family 2 protein [Candidatus Pacearchaeota archaeon]|nr:glycosyltransferase family 2 protein [Candidatus Pacearchaeota archaeon]